MTSDKIYNSLTHNIAHHAASGLSYLHPHLSQACKAHGTKDICLRLTEKNVYPHDFPVPDPLKLSTETLKKTFLEMISNLNLSSEKIESASLHFYFSPPYDDYTCVVESEVELQNGKKFVHKIDTTKQ